MAIGVSPSPGKPYPRVGRYRIVRLDMNFIVLEGQGVSIAPLSILVMAERKPIPEFSVCAGMNGGAWNRAEFTSAELDSRPFDLVGGLGDNVDDTVEGIKPIHDWGRTLQYLNAFNFRQRDRNILPRQPALHVDIDRAAIDHD